MLDRNTVQDREVVTVNPTLTVLVSPLQVWMVTSMAIEILNDDGSQTLTGTIQKATAEAGPWVDAGFSGFSDIAAGAGAYEVVDVSGLDWIRVVGTASGAGLSARVSATRYTGGTT